MRTGRIVQADRQQTGNRGSDGGMVGRQKRPGRAKRVNLALQGGGSHGAYTWGVLDRFLEDDRLEIEGISGTSAGAMNAAVLASGMAQGGRDGARAALKEFWKRISQAGMFGPVRRSVIDRWLFGWNLDLSPTYLMFDLASRMFSPYQFNPVNLNPLRTVLESSIDMDRLRASSPVKLYVSATNVRSGRVKIFDCSEMSIDALLASACLPHLFHAVEIDGEFYWDGGFMGNPAIFPLIYNCGSTDVVIVQVTPINRDEVPKTAPEIWDRVNEISFNSSLLREMRAINFVRALIDEHRLDETRYKRMNIHWINGEAQMANLGTPSKFNAEWDFLLHLFDIGRKTANDWLDQNFDKIGVESSVDLAAMFM